MARFRARSFIAVVGVLAVAAGLLALRFAFPERSLTAIGPRALLDGVFTVGLFTFVMLVSVGLGRVLIDQFFPGLLNAGELLLFSALLGLGFLAYQILLIGLMGALQPFLIGVLLAGNAIAVRKRILQTLILTLAELRRMPRHWAQLPWLNKSILIFASLIGLITFLRTFTPPWGYDALMYHLEGPRLFLEAGKVVRSLSQWNVNLPFTVEMLYTIGLAFESDTFAKVIHLWLAFLFVAATFTFAKRFASNSVAWLSVAILLGMAILSEWASVANVDFGVASFEILAIYGVFLWREKKRRNLLILSGMLLGFALGSKYSAFASMGALALLILWSDRRRAPRQVAKDLGSLVAPALIIAAPWYLMNLLWLGDPVFPFLGGGASIDAPRMRLLRAYFETTGPTETLLDWVLMPVRLFTRPELFSDIEPILSRPSPIFLVLLAYPLVKQSRMVTLVTLLALVRLFLLGLGIVVARHLLPTYALLSIGASYVIHDLSGPRFFSYVAGKVMSTAVIVSLLISFILQIGLYMRMQPLGVTTGAESKDQFLRRMVATYPAVSFAEQMLPDRARMLSTGDGRLYYCQETCLASDDQFNWLELTLDSANASEFQYELVQAGATFLLVSWRDLDYFRLHSPDGLVERATNRLLKFVEDCGEVIYEDQDAVIYAFDCRT